ncbi:sigma-70 family RNA polymerase sigma factor [Flaviflagellibacter deserti]|jgi:RNA polymerase sigma-70 factor, ECF subfamily|uniref:RNA polymerase sigma factor n=1 Tax=Flaviflagellibacter deserti TaxID=2267266 RepID=A0ABV9Z687_9HYPH
MSGSPSVRDELLAQIPSLRAFAVSLCGQMDKADDLVQEALVKAWSSLGSFTEGTNMRAWLFTILRNVYYSEHRKRRREVQDVDGVFSGRLVVHPSQIGHMDLQDFREALANLPPDQREALILVGASGFSYEEAASICGVAVGTIKSRVNRARSALTRALSVQGTGEFGPEPTLQAAMITTAGSGS